jgi:hypothetical protein
MEKPGLNVGRIGRLIIIIVGGAALLALLIYYFSRPAVRSTPDQPFGAPGGTDRPTAGGIRDAAPVRVSDFRGQGRAPPHNWSM